MYVLDTNVVSELMRDEPDPSVTAWMATRDTEEIFLTAINKAELHVGISLMPLVRRRRTLENALTKFLDRGFKDRILPFDGDTVVDYAEILAERRNAGRPISEADCQIAAICRSRNATLVTRNKRDFDCMDLNIVNPWSE